MCLSRISDLVRLMNRNFNFENCEGKYILPTSLL